MKNIAYPTLRWLVIPVFVVLFGCSQDSDYYKTFLDSGEITYTGKIDSVQVFSGLNRVRVRGIIDSDPKIEELRIYWNLRNDSTVVPITRSAGADTVDVMVEDLPENIYTFEFVTFDDRDNPSVSQTVTAEVYGNRYRSSLFNRPLAGDDLNEDTLSVTFASMDRSTGVIGSEIVYTSTSGEEKSRFVDIEEETAVITDFANGSTYRYRTAFVPEQTAIDTAYTEYDSYTPVAVPKLLNAAAPFDAGEVNGRWGTLASPWVTNEAVKNRDGGVGGWDNGKMNVESGWGAPAVTNGKVHQTVSDVPPGRYELSVVVEETNLNAEDEGGSYFVVTKSDTLPNVSELAEFSALMNHTRIDGARTYTLPFTVEASGSVTVGMLTTQSDAGRYGRITSWALNLAE